MRALLLCLAARLILFSPSLFSQSLNVPSGEDVQNGLRPFHNVNGGDIDSVDLSTGKLTVNIPLISYPQRGGKLSLGFALRYSNTGTFVPGCLPSAFSNGLCALVFPYESGFSIVETGRPGGGVGCEPTTSTFWQQAIAENPFGSLDGTSFNAGGQSIPITSIQYVCTASVTTPDGASHPMEAINATTFLATDASGFRVDILPGSDVRNPQHFASVITDPQGNRFPGYFFDSPPSSRVLSEDSNGNQILSGSDSGWVDTLGRNIPNLPSFQSGLAGPYVAGVSGATTDFSGCTGPLPVAGAGIWELPGMDGASVPIKFCFAEVPEINDGGDLHILNPDGTGTTLAMPSLPTTATQLQSVVLPNGTSWTFEYETHYGNLTRITFPTGGTISYTWEVIPRQVVNANNLPLFTLIEPQAVTSRTVSPNDGSGPDGKWSYQYLRTFNNPTNLPVGQAPWATVVTDPALNDTLHVFEVKAVRGYFIFPTYEHLETLTQSFNGSYPGAPVLKTVQRGYLSYSGNTGSSISNGAVPSSVTTILDNQLQSQTITQWDDGVPIQRSIYNANGVWIGACNNCGKTLYGQTLLTQEFDYGQGGPGPLLRSVATPHLALINPDYLANNMLSLVSSKTATDGGGQMVSEVKYGFDEAGLSSSGIATQHEGNPPVGNARGNITSESHTLNTPANSCSSGVPDSATAVSHTTFFDTGEPAAHVDALGNSTTFSYSSLFAGAFPTQVCNALHQCVTSDYDLNTGLKTSVTDPNNQTTSYNYDITGRVVNVTFPAQDVAGTIMQGVSSYLYVDSPGALSVTRVDKQDASASLTESQTFDGLGRQIGSRQTDLLGDVLTKTTYDGFGRISSVTNPYRSVTDPTYGVTQTLYDPLGRISQVTHPDGSSIVTSYTGRAVQIQDEGNGTTRVTRITQKDGADRTTSVCEVSATVQVNEDAPSGCGQDISGNGFLTSYSYNGADELVGVHQGGLNRSFVYDTGGHLANSTNPETGTTCYRYDLNGNVLSRTRPAPNQSNPLVTVTTNYSYDPLNRPVSITYTDSITPHITKHYDTLIELGVGLSNTIGRLSAEYATSPSGALLSGHVYSYDPLGRVIDNSQCTPQNCGSATVFPVQYSYNLLGKPITATNGKGIVFTYGYDEASRLVSMTSGLADANHPANLFGNATYSPLGRLSGARLGNVINESLSYNNRGWLISYTSSVDQPLAVLPPRYPVFDHERRPQFHPQVAGAARALTNSIRIAGGQGHRTRRGSLGVSLTSLDLLEPRRVARIDYRTRESSLSLARRLAAQINRDPGIPLRATVRRQGATTCIDLADKTIGKISNWLVSVDVQATQGPPLNASVTRWSGMYVRPVRHLASSARDNQAEVIPREQAQLIGRSK